MEVKVEYGTSTPYNPNTGNYNSNPAYPRPVETQRVSGWCQRNHKNKPQSNSVGSSALVFLTGGISIAWSVGYHGLLGTTVHLLISWFIGGIIGALVAAFACNYLQRKLIYLFSALLVTISGVLLTSLSTDYDGVIAARYLNGIANGLVFVPTLVLAGEEAVMAMRGMLTSTIESMCFALGMFFQTIIFSTWIELNASFDSIQMQGVFFIVCGVLSFVIAFFFFIESPIFYLMRNQEQEAIESLRRLQRPFVITTETYEQLEEHKRYIAINREMTSQESALAGLPALLKLCLYRALNALSFANYITFAVLIYSLVSGSLVRWPFVLYGALRWVAVLINGLMLDSVGRKKPLLFGALVCGGIAIGLGVMFTDISTLTKMTTALVLILILQFFAGIFVPASSTYLAEAFPLEVKPAFIAITFIIEMLAYIIPISVGMKYLYSIGYFFYAFGALMLVFFVLGIICLPETKFTTLREAQQKFRNFKA